MQSRCEVQAASDDLGDVVAGGQALGHLGAIVIGGEPMAAGPEMRGNHAEHRQEPVGCAGGAEAFHGAFTLPGRLVRSSARSFRYGGCRCSTDDITSRCATG